MTAFTAEQQSAALAAFDTWAAVANIQRSGTETDWASTIAFANVRFLGTGSNLEAATPVSSRRSEQRVNLNVGDVWLNTGSSYISNGAYTTGSANFETLLHEIGHALGIKHAFADQGPDTEGLTLPEKWNSTRYTVISYGRLLGNNGPHASTPMLLDIAAVQRLYGANRNTRTEDNTYRFELDSAGWPVQAIWDAGGVDIYYVDETGDTVVESTNGGLDTVNSAIDYVLGAGIENLVLTGTEATYGTGNELDNVIIGDAGYFNVLRGEGGNDRLVGLLHDDMYGGVGDDTYVVNDEVDQVFEYAGEGRDTIESYLSLTLAANVEDVTLVGTSAISATGNSADNVLVGNGSNNTLRGSGGADTLRGAGGDDTYVIDALDTLVEQANEGNDTIQASFSYTLQENFERLTLTGTSSINATGNSVANTLTGNSGANLLDGGAGGDSMSGGSGNDTYYVDHSGDTVSDSSSTGGTDRVFSSVTFTLGSNVEHLTLTGTGNINGTGNSLANEITGNAGNNTLSGGTGADTLAGGAGDDTYVVDNAGDIVNESANEGSDLVQAGLTYTLGAHLDHLTLTGSTNFNGTGNTLDNVLTGNGGSNTLTGWDGNDTLNGGSGSDTMLGGVGNDIYVVAQTGDVVTENASEGIDTVQSSIAYTLGNHVEQLTLTGTNATNGSGNALDNVLIGNGSNNTLSGNSGNDTLDGGTAGTDVLRGGLGNDTYVVGRTSGITITENANEGTDAVQASVTHTLGSNVENLTLTGTSAINGTGNDLSNVLTGNAGNNALTGAAGNDTLVGGDGADIYSYSSGNGSDTINNASTDSAQDRLNVTNMTRSQVTFTQSANDLVMTRNGTPTDSVRVTDWFAANGNQLDFVQFTDQTLTTAQINAMFGGSGLLTAQPQGSEMASAPNGAMDSAARQFIDAINHFDGRNAGAVIVDGNSDNTLGSLGVELIAPAARERGYLRDIEHKLGRLLA